MATSLQLAPSSRVSHYAFLATGRSSHVSWSKGHQWLGKRRRLSQRGSIVCIKLPTRQKCIQKLSLSSTSGLQIPWLTFLAQLRLELLLEQDASQPVLHATLQLVDLWIDLLLLPARVRVSSVRLVGLKVDVGGAARRSRRSFDGRRSESWLVALLELVGKGRIQRSEVDDDLSTFEELRRRLESANQVRRWLGRARTHTNVAQIPRFDFPSELVHLVASIAVDDKVLEELAALARVEGRQVASGGATRVGGHEGLHLGAFELLGKIGLAVGI